MKAIKDSVGIYYIGSIAVPSALAAETAATDLPVAK